MTDSPVFVLVLVTIAIFFVWGVISLASWRWCPKKNFPLLAEHRIFLRAYRVANLWLLVSMFWMIVDYLITMLSFTATMIVIYIQAERKTTEGILFCSIIAASLIVFGFAINPKQQMRAYRKAFTILDREINKFCEGPPNETSGLIAAMEAGEDEINKSYHA